MKTRVITAMIMTLIACSCNKDRTYTNEYPGTVWEGIEISKDIYDVIIGLDPDTSYHRLEFLDWSDSKVHHYYFSQYDNEWHSRGIFEYDILPSYGLIRMGWEITRWDDTLSHWMNISEDGTSMHLNTEYDNGGYNYIYLKRVR